MFLHYEGNNFHTRVLYPAKLATEHDNTNKDIFGHKWSLEITSQALVFQEDIGECYPP